MYRMFASDMDGTLLNNEFTVAPATTAAIERANEAGKIFTVVSGRPIRSVLQFADTLPLQYPFGSYNGAMIADKSGKVYYERPLEREDARLVLELAHERNTQIFLWIGQEMYGNVWDDILIRYARLSGVTPRMIENEEELLQHPFLKILWYDSAENIAKWLAEFTESLKGRMNVSTSAPEYIEFNHVDVSKGACLKKIAELLGVPLEEVIAAGDETNDIQMLREAGLGIAMKNSTDAVFEWADVVSPWTNDEDGLAKLMDKYFL